MPDKTLIKISNLYVEYHTNKGILGGKSTIHAVNGVSLDIYKGEILAIAGESGCGKSTLAKALTQLEPVKSGEIFFNGQNILTLDKKKSKKFHQTVQMVFQNPYTSLNPKMKICDILKEPLEINTDYTPEKIYGIVKKKISLVGLDESCLELYPHEFSGGQRQRIAIARALMLEPDFIIADEPVSALDVSIQAQIINLIKELNEKYGITFLLITHDISVIKYLADRVAVMYLGEIVEIAASDELFKNPKHPYTKALLSAVPTVGSKKYTDTVKIEGDLPSPKNPPKACKFHTRCPFAMKICSEIAPEYTRFSATHKAKCHLFKE